MTSFLFGSGPALELQVEEDIARTDAERLPTSAAHAIRAIDTKENAFANRLAALFQASPSDKCDDCANGPFKSCKIVRDLPCPSGPPVFSDNKGRYFQPLATADGPVHADDANLDGLIELLEQFEPLLQIFEERTGHAFEPASLTEHWSSDTVWIEFANAIDQPEKDQSWSARFGFARKYQHVQTLPEPSVICDLQNLPVAVQLILRGPALDLSDAEKIASGDILLLGVETLTAKLIADPQYSGKPQITEGCLNLRSGHFQRSGVADATSPPQNIQQGKPAMPDDAATETPEPNPKSFKVPINICLRDVAVPAEALTRLTQGSTLDLMPVREGLQVDLNVAGQMVGRGEIVKLGESFAVLMDHVSAEDSQMNEALDQQKSANAETD
ncbi:FliM/FliN family flagellar motor switch protein [Parasphingorhabdus cellanae]|uniref:FliM/FliN family flagellar motor switch protein n=1 Tax=Parasphingorhabdus cellanae TaxID=2806553 RepID=A0ABX7T6N7_9SPHN|nr:FliM/FliN family flagellar motor switch protein [Parasphingorhabdus cellanae]QTD56129.1 FliM/FliN family flagellar motor switch protein [Parasphingorhabdus cellanae]